MRWCIRECLSNKSVWFNASLILAIVAVAELIILTVLLPKTGWTEVYRMSNEKGAADFATSTRFKRRQASC